MSKSKPDVALFLGVPPVCDRCAEEDAKCQITLPNLGQRSLCATCLTHLIEVGLTTNKGN